ARLALRGRTDGRDRQVVGLVHDRPPGLRRGDAGNADRHLTHVRGGHAESVVEPQRLVGRDADRLAIRADEPFPEDRRRKRVDVVGLERLQVVVEHAGRPRQLVDRHSLLLTQTTQVGADARHTSSVAYPAAFFTLLLSPAYCAFRLTETRVESPGSSMVTP